MSVISPEESGKAQLIDSVRLQALVEKLFVAAGLSDEHAHGAADVLVESDLRGVWSHGVARVPMYLSRLRAGVANAKPNIKVDRVAPAALLIDGDNGLGLVVAPHAMRQAVALAKETGIAVAGIRRSGHFATSAYNVRIAVEAGCIGFVYTNSSPAIAPWGGATPFLGTSPFGFAAPTTGGRTFLIDMAMSRLARGKMKFSAQRGDPIPLGYAVDKSGQPTTDGKAAFEGTMVPFGEYKGAALSWMMDVLGGVFTGAAFGGEVANPFDDLSRPQNVGHVFIAMRADLFMSAETFEQRMAELDRRAKALPRAEGFTEILAPGEPEARQRAINIERGVPLTNDVLQALHAETVEARVEWPFTAVPAI
jgi:L-2-hydroxycarboxylate dehydrogenase (NAD+)